MQKAPSQKSCGFPDTYYKIVGKKFPIYNLKQKRAEKVKMNNQDPVKVENTPTHHRREQNVSGTTQD